jgi:hypothetical protein
MEVLLFLLLYRRIPSRIERGAGDAAQGKAPLTPISRLPVGPRGLGVPEPPHQAAVSRDVRGG